MPDQPHVVDLTTPVPDPLGRASTVSLDKGDEQGRPAWYQPATQPSR